MGCSKLLPNCLELSTVLGLLSRSWLHMQKLWHARKLRDWRNREDALEKQGREKNARLSSTTHEGRREKRLSSR